MRRESAAQRSTERESRVGSRGIELTTVPRYLVDRLTGKRPSKRAAVSCRPGRAGQGRGGGKYVEWWRAPRCDQGFLSRRPAAETVRPHWRLSRKLFRLSLGSRGRERLDGGREGRGKEEEEEGDVMRGSGAGIILIILDPRNDGRENAEDAIRRLTGAMLALAGQSGRPVRTEDCNGHGTKWAWHGMAWQGKPKDHGTGERMQDRGIGFLSAV